MTRTVKKADGFRKESAKAREAYAKTALNAETILGEAAKAAALGEQAHAIMFDRPVDLPRTEAAESLKALLLPHGFAVEWEKRTAIMGGMEKTFWTLIIRW